MRCGFLSLAIVYVRTYVCMSRRVGIVDFGAAGGGGFAMGLRGKNKRERQKEVIAGRCLLHM